MITPETLKAWLSQQPQDKSLWRDLACCTRDDSKPRKGLLLAVDFAYFRELDSDGKIRISKEETRVRYGKIRKVLTQKDGLYKFINCVEDLLSN